MGLLLVMKAWQISGPRAVCWLHTLNGNLEGRKLACFFQRTEWQLPEVIMAGSPAGHQSSTYEKALPALADDIVHSDGKLAKLLESHGQRLT